MQDDHFSYKYCYQYGSCVKQNLTHGRVLLNNPSLESKKYHLFKISYKGCSQERQSVSFYLDYFHEN